MSRSDKRRRRRAGLPGRDQLFALRVNPRLVDAQQAQIQGEIMHRGNDKGGSKDLRGQNWDGPMR